MEGEYIDKVDGRLYEDLCASCSNSSKPMLMGSSVHFDRAFMAVHMPRSQGVLHHRQLDVTSIRLWWQLMSGKDPLTWDKKAAHRAEDDVEETLNEAMEYWRRR